MDTNEKKMNKVRRQFAGAFFGDRAGWCLDCKVIGHKECPGTKGCPCCEGADDTNQADNVCKASGRA